jgi:hypothetical protein
MAKRELIDTGSDKRYVRRNKGGQFNEWTTLGVHSLPIGGDVPRPKRSPAKGTSRPAAAKAQSSKGRKKAASRKGAARKSARKKGTKRR